MAIAHGTAVAQNHSGFHLADAFAQAVTGVVHLWALRADNSLMTALGTQEIALFLQQPSVRLLMVRRAL